MKSGTKSHGTRIRSKLPARGTRAAYDYFESWKQINRFVDFVLSLVGHAEHFSEVANEFLVRTETDAQKREELIATWKSRRGPGVELKESRQFFLEIVLVRHVENYLNYISSLLLEIFTQRPETLRSSDKIEVATILQHDSIESIVCDLAERKVDSLSYTSFTDLVAFIFDRFGIAIVDDNQLQKINEAIEIRNISVHNRCIVSKRFVSRLNRPRTEVGRRYSLYIGYLDEFVPLFADSVKSIDRAIAKKLKIHGVRFNAMQKSRRSASSPSGDISTKPSRVEATRLTP